MGLKNGTILILDEQNSLRESLKTCFEKTGATVYTSSHIEKGISLLEGLVKSSKFPEIIIMDVRLPDSFGFNSLNQIQRALAGVRVPIIVASWGFSNHMIDQMRLYGVVGYIKKPVLMEKIFRFSNEILNIIEANTLAAHQAKQSIANIKSA